MVDAQTHGPQPADGAAFERNDLDPRRRRQFELVGEQPDKDDSERPRQQAPAPKRRNAKKPFVEATAAVAEGKIAEQQTRAGPDEQPCERRRPGRRLQAAANRAQRSGAGEETANGVRALVGAPRRRDCGNDQRRNGYPVLNSHNRPIAGLAVSLPKHDFSDEEINKIVADVREIAKKMSIRLGADM